jgi:hypothetical protein
LNKDVADDEKETEPTFLHVINPLFNTKPRKHPANGIVAGMLKNVKSQNKQYGINDTWNKYPFP